MPITQMPLRGARSSPPPSENDLYDARRWETVYRELHATPTLLIQLQDDLSRSRLREAFWISVIFHLLVLMAIIESDTLARWFPFHKWFPSHSALLVTPVTPRDKELTYLELPPDAQKPVKRPNTNIISDRDRTAMSTRPHIDPEELRKILGGRSGPPAPPGPGGQSAQPAKPAVEAQNAPPQAQPREQPRPAPPANTNQVAKLEAPPHSKVDFGAPMSAHSAVEQAARAAAANRGSGYGGAGGDYGLSGGRQATAEMGPYDVLSDTMGVDFGPYLNRVLHDVRLNWYNLIPEVARPPIMKKGKVTIEFAITKDGRVAGMKLAATSGDVALDRPAWGAITDSNPFPPLPKEFGGQYLALKFYFLYNPDSPEL